MIRKLGKFFFIRDRKFGFITQGLKEKLRSYKATGKVLIWTSRHRKKIVCFDSSVF